MARWGFVPSWSGDLSLGAGMINALAETLDQKPVYRTVLTRNAVWCRQAVFMNARRKVPRASRRK